MGVGFIRVYFDHLNLSDEEDTYGDFLCSSNTTSDILKLRVINSDLARAYWGSAIKKLKLFCIKNYKEDDWNVFDIDPNTRVDANYLYVLAPARSVWSNNTIYLPKKSSKDNTDIIEISSDTEEISSEDSNDLCHCCDPHPGDVHYREHSKKLHN